MARDAVIVSTARTPIGRAYKGAFNATPGPTLGALSLAPAIERAGIEAGQICWSVHAVSRATSVVPSASNAATSSLREPKPARE